jgi:hypothetical protein
MVTPMRVDEMRHPRVFDFDAQYRLHGQRFVDLVAGLYRSDELADRAVEALETLALGPGQAMASIDEALAGRYADIPEALVELVEEAARVPRWVDWDRIHRGGAAMARTGLIGGLTLGNKCLVEGYCAPAGNKPLAFSGRLTSQAAMRLSETARFVEAVSAPEGMRRDQAGFAITLRVRLMHARVRALIERSGRWREDLWAKPINQHDMVATIHLFSTAFIDGVAQLGWVMSRREEEDVLHLWRYIGHVIGVDDELLPRTIAQARAQWAVIAATQGPPDDDSRALTMALLEGPLRDATTDEQRARARVHVAVSKQICRELIGAARADAMGIPRQPVGPLRPLVKSMIKTLNASRQVRAVEPWLEVQGRRYWDHTIALTSQGRPIRFVLPGQLAGLEGR